MSKNRWLKYVPNRGAEAFETLLLRESGLDPRGSQPITRRAQRDHRHDGVHAKLETPHRTDIESISSRRLNSKILRFLEGNPGDLTSIPLIAAENRRVISAVISHRAVSRVLECTFEYIGSESVVIVARVGLISTMSCPT